MTIYGEFPPLETLPNDALRRSDVQYLLSRLDVRWADLDSQRHDPTLVGDSAAVLDEQQLIENIQAKLKVLL